MKLLVPGRSGAKCDLPTAFQSARHDLGQKLLGRASQYGVTSFKASTSAPEDRDCLVYRTSG